MTDPTPAPAAHLRVNEGVLATLEKRALVWMAERLPPFVNADHLTAIGLAGMLATAASFAALPLTPWAAPAVLLFLTVNWLGDSLDGTVARVRGHQRPRYGYYVDHVIDLVGVTALVAGMAYSSLMSPLLAAVFLAAYLLVSAEVYLATHAGGVFQMSRFGLGPTELRVLLGAGAFAATGDPRVPIAGLGAVRLFDLGAVVAASTLVLVFVVSALQTARRLHALEPRPGYNPGLPRASPRRVSGVRHGDLSGL